MSINFRLGKMRWQEGTLYLKPSDKFEFGPFYEFPEIVGNSEVNYMNEMLRVNEDIESSTGQKQRSLKLSTGIGTFFQLRKKGWQVVRV